MALVAARAVELRLGSCFDPRIGMPSLPNWSVDHVITDPPYSKYVHGKSRGGVTGWRARQRFGNIARVRDFGFAHMTDPERHAAAREFARVARRWVVVFSDLESAHLWIAALEAAGLEFIRLGVWVKVGAAPQFTGDRPGAGAEAIIAAKQPGADAIVVAHQRHARLRRKRWNAGGKLGVWTVPIELDRSHKAPRIHTSQKPLRLMRELVEDFTDPGEVVLDPYAGGGTTGVACAQLGRRFIGWEKNGTFYRRAAARLARAA